MAKIENLPITAINPDGYSMRVTDIADNYAYVDGKRAETPSGKRVEVVLLGGDYRKLRIIVPSTNVSVGETVEATNCTVTISGTSEPYGISISAKADGLTAVDAESFDVFGTATKGGK